MVYRRRYNYNGRPFISVVYFGRLRTPSRRNRRLPLAKLFVPSELVARITTATLACKRTTALAGHDAQVRSGASETMLSVVQLALNAARLTHTWPFPRVLSRSILITARLSDYETFARSVCIARCTVSIINLNNPHA